MSLEIVIPAHNEEHRIAQTLEAYSSELLQPDLTITVALDDCTDNTAEIVASYAACDHRIRAKEYPRLGKGGVLSEAFRSSETDVVAFVDADCATPPSEIEVLTQTLDETGADIAIASRWHPTSVLPKPRPLGRRIASRGFATAVRTMFALPYADTQCGAKVLTHRAASRVMPLMSSRDFVFDVDLLLVARGLGLHVAEVPTVWIDRDGSSIRIVHDTVHMAASLGLLWLHHHVVPVQLPSRPAVGSPARPAITPAITPAVNPVLSPAVSSVITPAIAPVIAPVAAHAPMSRIPTAARPALLRDVQQVVGHVEEVVEEGGLSRAS